MKRELLLAFCIGMITLCVVTLGVTGPVATAYGATGNVSPSEPGTGLGAPAQTEGLAPGVLGAAGATDVKNLNTGNTYATIDSALADPATLNGHVIEVQVSPHAEGIVNVTKSVTIQGMTGTEIVNASASTGSSGDARGWFVINADNVTIQGLTLDGSGFQIYQTIRCNNAGLVVDNCTIQHIKYQQYLGFGITSVGNATVTDCTMSDIERLGILIFGAGVTSGSVDNLTYTGKGPGDWLDYAVEFGGGAVGSVTNSTVTGCAGTALSDGSTSAGFIATDYFGPGTAVTYSGNTVGSSTSGIGMGFLGTDATVVSASDNDFSGNDYGIASASTAVVVDGSANWWGSNDAATVAAYMDGDVDYTPYLDVGTDIGDPGFQGDFSALHADAASPQSGGLGAIAEALGLVTASTVYLAPGTYNESVVVTGEVVIDGAGDGANPAVDSIIIPLTGTRGFDLQAGGSSASSRLTIRDLRVAGGIGGVYTNSAIDHVTLENVTFTGAAGYGVEIHNDAVVGDVVLTDCDFIGNTVGMRVRGALDGLDVSGGHFDGNSANGLYSVADVAGGSNFLNVSFVGTTFDNNAGKGIYVEKLSDAVFDGIQVVNSGTGGTWGAGIDVNLKFDDYQNISFLEPTVTGCGTGDPVNGVGLTLKARDDGATYGANPATLNNVLVVDGTITGNQNGIRVGEPGKGNAGPTGVDVHGCTISGNIGAGFDNQCLATPLAACNWWGALAGPNDPPGNPSTGDDIIGSAVYAPWLDGVGGVCDQYGDNYVAGDPTGLCISTPTACVTMPVEFTRLDTTPARGVTVTIALSGDLALCVDPATSIVQGDWLDGYGLGSTFQVLDQGGGVYVIDQAVLGGTASCGPTTGGTLFTLDLTNTGGDGTGTVSVTAVDARDCGNPFALLPGIPGPDAVVTIDYTAPALVADLAASQVKSGNDSDGTTEIDLAWTAPPETDVATVELYRKGFGFYPEYDDDGGAAPAAPADPTAAVTAGWTHVVSLAGAASAYTDEPAARDYWYYVAFVIDNCGNISDVSNRTDGTLNYHLGDVAVSPGDNLVAGVDISALAAYATSHGDALYDNELDVGPTADNSTDALPDTDNQIQFEDLIIMAINYGMVSKPQPASAAADRNAIALKVEPAAGVIEAVVSLASDGSIQGVSVPLTWNAAAVEPVSIREGAFLDRQRGLPLLLSPGAGAVDAAVFGSTFAGEGELATITFRVIGGGEPEIALGEVLARDGENREVKLTLAMDRGTLPTLTRLLPCAPNPFLSATVISFALAEEGPVTLRIYAVDGRLVRTLVQAVMPAGERSVQWDGRDESGRAVASGAYLLRLETNVNSESQRIVRLQ